MLVSFFVLGFCSFCLVFYLPIVTFIVSFRDRKLLPRARKYNQAFKSFSRLFRAKHCKVVLVSRPYFSFLRCLNYKGKIFSLREIVR